MQASSLRTNNDRTKEEPSEVLNVRTIIIAVAVALALTPATARTPSIEQLVGAYQSMPWQVDPQRTLACVAAQEARVVDYIVGQLAKRALAKVTCS